MARITPTTITGGYASIDALNANFVALAAEFEKPIYKDGETDNAWTANQDANSKKLLNLPDAIDAQEPATLSQLDAEVAELNERIDTTLSQLEGQPFGDFAIKWTDLTDGGETILHSHAAQQGADHGQLVGLADNDHPQYLLVAAIDDVPVNGEVAAPISSNWAFDHEAAADPHPGYLTPAEGNATYWPLSTDLATQVELDAHINDSADAHDASAISILDTANDFTATDVEGALAELQADAEADAQALADHLSDAADAHDASAVSFTPNGSIAATDVQAAIQEVRDEASGGMPRMYGAGLVQSQAVDTDHDTTISIGAARDSTNAEDLTLAAAITKRIDASWVVGTAQGGLDGSESVAGTPDATTWYYIHLIKRSDTGVVDALYSESATAPTMPASYDLRRLIGAVLTDGAANIVTYTAYETEGGGLELSWTAPTVDVNLAATLTTSRRTDAVKVPLSFSVRAKLRIMTLDSVGAALSICTCPDEADIAPGTSTGSLYNSVVNTAVALNDALERFVRTSATGLVASRSDTATVDTYKIATLGFLWARRN